MILSTGAKAKIEYGKCAATYCSLYVPYVPLRTDSCLIIAPGGTIDDICGRVCRAKKACRVRRLSIDHTVHIDDPGMMAKWSQGPTGIAKGIERD